MTLIQYGTRRAIKERKVHFIPKRDGRPKKGSGSEKQNREEVTEEDERKHKYYFQMTVGGITIYLFAGTSNTNSCSGEARGREG